MDAFSRVDYRETVIVISPAGGLLSFDDCAFRSQFSDANGRGKMIQRGAA